MCGSCQSGRENRKAWKPHKEQERKTDGVKSFSCAPLLTLRQQPRWRTALATPAPHTRRRKAGARAAGSAPILTAGTQQGPSQRGSLPASIPQCPCQASLQGSTRHFTHLKEMSTCSKILNTLGLGGERNKCKKVETNLFPAFPVTHYEGGTGRSEDLRSSGKALVRLADFSQKAVSLLCICVSIDVITYTYTSTCVRMCTCVMYTRYIP